ncbi:uncharacterized protein HMPREF1541_03993 [Cyphellophora europaea CBS 101466]|uniref:Uncharacterized protein n=1 Tax=Cyphellophora europaea (strain CBS 101466) TaxID=1220924 RepID=W2S272_CYPE1|nr:uncharacterized protein HMPREF1541_03993 [Cyphellophora europaea CBS 101466]ETN42054.1 hypothetical protein HMPREF1541_03993 [Cyphellophora europaea CBS 101466]
MTSYSLPSRTRLSPDNEVERLISEANQLHTMPPKMQRFLNTYPLFTRVIARQVRMVTARSQDFDDCQVTIFDKALLVITRNGNDIGSAIPFQFFCQYWCDYDPAIASPTESMYDMAKFAVLPFDADYYEYYPDDGTLQGGRSSSPIDVSQLGARNQPGLKRLISTYELAVSEYFDVESRHDDQTLRAAKYLRDTAENTIAYLKETDIDRGKLSEIEAMYETAKQVVQNLTGRVRKFDIGYATNEQQTNGHGGRGESRRFQHEFRRPAGPRRARENENWREVSHEPYVRRAEGKDRLRRSQSPPAERGERGRDKVDERGIRVKGRGQGCGARGHSGIPYGYREDRVVDSYKPDA